MKTIAVEQFIDNILSGVHSEQIKKQIAIEALSKHFNIPVYMQRFLEVLVSEDNVSHDISTIMSDILKDRGLCFFAITNLREKRIKESRITFKQFVHDFQQNSIQACKYLFCEPVDSKMIDDLMSKIDNGMITLESLYNKHIQYPSNRFKTILC